MKKRKAANTSKNSQTTSASRYHSSRRHPSLDIVGTCGNELAGKRIVLCLAGSVAAYKAIELARLLMRHGADVVCVESRAAANLITPSYLKWATGNDVITKLSGNLEHIEVADYRRSDLIVVYPCTANTLGKFANGIDDTPISTVLSVALGSKIPIIVALAMHQAMYENSAVIRNMDFLRKNTTVEFVKPDFTEGKAKAAEPQQILELILDNAGKKGLENMHKKRILITAGPTVEHIDPVRVITNLSTGKTGFLVASEMISAGAIVTLIHGPSTEKIPVGLQKCIAINTVQEMHEAVKKELRQRKYDIVILSAAAADYVPKKRQGSKIKSKNNKTLSLELEAYPKIIEQVRKFQKDVFLVGFKAEVNVSKTRLIEKAKEAIRRAGADIIIANDIGSKYLQNPDKNEAFVVDGTSKGAVAHSGRKDKEKIARFIAKQIVKRLNR